MHATVPTTPTTLTDRYIDAAMRTVPEQQRGDLSAELRASIEDQIEARVEQGEGFDAAEFAVLTELGDPDRLAAGYTDRPLWLVGPRYFLDWWRLLKLLLWIVIPIAGVAVALGQTLSGADIGEIIAQTVVVAMNVALQLFFWVTLIFVILERTGHETMTAGRWTPDRLPEPRQRGAGLSDLVASLVFLGVAAGAILWDRFVGFAYVDGEWMPFLSPALWPWWIGALFVLMALEALLAISVYAKGRWDAGSATVNLFLNLTIAGGALWLLTRQELVNPEFLAAVLPDADASVTAIVSTVFGFAIVAVAVWDSVDAYLKASRAR